MNKFTKRIIFKSVALGSICTAVYLLSIRLSFHLGYCKAFDERTGADNIKPSYLWLKTAKKER